MELLKGLTKIVLSPIYGAAELVKDISGNNSDDSQMLSLYTVGVSSVIKGVAKAIKIGAEDIFEDKE